MIIILLEKESDTLKKLLKNIMNKKRIVIIFVFFITILLVFSLIGVVTSDPVYSNVSLFGSSSETQNNSHSLEYPKFDQDPVLDDGSKTLEEIVQEGIPQNSKPDDTKNQDKVENNSNGVGNSGNVGNVNNPSDNLSPSIGNETKAIWLSYLDLNYLLKGKSQQSFTSSITKAFDNMASIGLNTVFVHVRPFSDAIYQSDLFPWSSYASGSLGKSPGFDPLKIMIDIAHRKGIQVHAWINPMRGLNDSEIQRIGSNYKLRQWYDDNSKRGDYIFKHTDGRWYYNPGVPEVLDLISAGAAEIVRKYQIDGIHIDDYFYPSGTQASYDAAAYNRYTSSGGKQNLSNWRIDNTNKLVKSMYNAIKGVKNNVAFGVSPSGNNSYNVNTMFCDPRIWVSQPGYLDYIAPQIYYGFNNSAKPFEKTVNEWSSYIKLSNVKYFVGLAPYKIGKEDTHAGSSGKNEWIENVNSSRHDMMKNQIISSRKASRYSGIAFYDYKSLFTTSGAIQPNMKNEIENFKGLLK